MMLEVEGDNPEWFMRLIRHEAAHAYAFAYQLPAKKRWPRVFGLTPEPRPPDSTGPDPTATPTSSTSTIWYAQSHPDEDFAETFAVWLTPGLDWRPVQGMEGAAKTRVRRRVDGPLADRRRLFQPAYRVTGLQLS